ncbi:PilZ domain-containing protein [Paramagnetospirillum kuznetsovii]|nr:PilZ domain-containing protein [Paramagnetospirillum kuznetsovii]
MPGRKSSNNDRRVDDRHEGEGLFMVFENNLVEVVDISVGGLKFKRPPFDLAPGRRFSFELRSAYEDPNPLAKGIAVVRASKEDWVAIEFVRPTFSLMKVVGRHIGRLLVGRSHLFRH